ncbi:hypothetical protein [Paenibacillus sp. sgz500958]|uniref:hypothetical protein n=1 Tax=Paenibacillus sp. sgz500958 TaxID=3242475 RepID=UPI0036D42A26
MDTDKRSRNPGSSGRRKVILKPKRVDYPRMDRENREEYAAEISPVQMRTNSNIDKAETADETGGKTMGYVGLAFGIGSLFMWSIILGPVAAVLGYFAYSRGQKTTGAWAMGLGIVSALSYFVMIPFAR